MKRVVALLLIACSLLPPLGCGAKPAAVDYADAENWAFFGEAAAEAEADLFFLCPTVDLGKDGHGNMALDDEKTKAAFVGATRMELGIYEGCRVYAPYYRQMTLSAYNSENSAAYLETAYQDAKAAFLYYMKHENNGRPFVLAGFSQGAELGLRLMQELFKKNAYAEQLVAAYLLGWRVTQDAIDGRPWMRMATGETDVGCIISFEAEAPEVTASFVAPAGIKMLSINPLNWRTDATPAKAAENLGACFTDYSGAIQQEIPALTGAYLDMARGTLKVPDVSSADYPPVLDLFADGEYHLYDYQFFYRNLQQNVGKRISAYLALCALNEAA